MNAPRSHRFDTWPAADQAAWRAATSTELSVLDQGECAHWSKTTRSQAVYEYGRWLSFLSHAHRGVLRQPPAARLTQERLSEFIQLLAARVRAQTVASCIGHLINAIHAIIPAHETM